MSNQQLTHEDFRKSGRTLAALNYPLSDAGYTWLRKFNGVPDGYRVPDTWRYASNEYMRDYIERQAVGV